MRNISGEFAEKKHILCSICFPCFFIDNVEKYVGTREATHNSIIQRMRIAWWITKTTEAYTEYVYILLLHNNG